LIVDHSALDRRWMKRALVLARRQAGATWPNPTVGCCIVRNGVLLAEAVHAGPGQPHAEAAALLALAAHRIDAAGATAYVTLEPCHHEGRTAPCSRALADAGVARVVYGAADETPRHPGGGGAWLAEQGIEVSSGVCGELAREVVHPFLETASDDEAHVTLKLALTADGKLARRPGRLDDPAQRAVTGQQVQRRVHRMRAGSGAVVVGAGTARADRPRLDVRLLSPGQWSGRPPLPVVLCGQSRVEAAEAPDSALVLEYGRAAWDSVFGELVRRGRGIVLVEGGAQIAGDLLAERPPHRIHLYLAGRGFGPGGVRLPGGIRLDDRYETLRVRPLGADVEWVLRRRDLG
jgi:diaminohydroxyphosphoribosylaminopyrimidine deaminase/5-amino-6-(5-phosphoribosylamino)uracil reductase